MLLPTGQVLAFNGADRDAVAGPGGEVGKRQAELFDPATERWSPLASSHDVRTYHNSAVLLPDGRVLVGGHAPISTLYLRNTTLPGGITAPNDGRDASFEIYNPPYMYVVLVSNPSLTHLVDANQRNVVPPVVGRKGNVLSVKAPPSADVAPPGPYLLFVNRPTPHGLQPSRSRQLFLGISGLEARAAAARRHPRRH